jgi:hypothetical protein
VILRETIIFPKYADCVSIVIVVFNLKTEMIITCTVLNN